MGAPLQFRVCYTRLHSVRLVEVTHAWQPRFYHQQLHVFFTSTRVTQLIDDCMDQLT
jgi:hypothetical protein